MSKKPLPKAADRALTVAVVIITVPLVLLVSGLITWPAVRIWQAVFGG